MARIVRIFTIVGLTVIPLLQSAPAHAQAARTWVSGVGDDANPCSRTAPCKTFASAMSKTAAGGEISVLDPGGFGAVTINKSLSITNEGAGEASVLAAGTNAIVVAAGAGDVVNLRGLVIDGGLPAFASLNGIRVLSARAVHVQNCVTKNFAGGFGIQVAPTSGTVQVFVNDTVVSNNGSGANGGGVLVRPSGAASARVTLTRLMVDGNVFGVRVDGSASSGGGNFLFVRDSVLSGNSQAAVSILGPPGSQAGNIFVERSAVIGNGSAGISADGASTSVLVATSTVTLNATGIATANAGSVFSFKNNQVNNNVSDGAFTPSGLGQN